MNISIERRVNGVLTSADTARLTVTNSGGTPVVENVTVAPTSAGIYTYDAGSLADGDYTATWTFVVAGFSDEIIYRAFSVDQPVVYHPGVTLAEIERHVAPRLGPYDQVISKVGSTESSVLIDEYKTSLDIGDYEDLYILRRGMLSNGARIENFVSTDRQRIVASYDHNTGSLVPDQDWSEPPIADELIELHYLNPRSELRRAVLQGLRRCYFWDAVSISTIDSSLYSAGRTTLDLTAAIPWLTWNAAIQEVRYGTGTTLPKRVLWHRTYRQGASRFLELHAAGAGSYLLSVLRPAYTWVNGETSYIGPEDDEDVLDVDLDYAAAAAHISAWMLFPHRLFPVANLGMRINMEQAAAVFTMESTKMVPLMPEYLNIRWGSEDSLMEMPQVGNA